MKKIVLVLAILVTTFLHADTLLQTFKGQLKTGMKISPLLTTYPALALKKGDRTHVLDLKKGKYRYVLKLTGSKKAKARLRIKKEKAVTLKYEKLVDAKKLKTRRTHEGTFYIQAKNLLNQDSGKRRKTVFILSKKFGPRKINYELSIYKIK